MFVQFQVNGDLVNTDQVLPSATPATNPTSNTPVTSASQFGGVQTGGYFGWYNAAGAKGYLYWLAVGNGVHRVWQMDSYAAAQTAVSNIMDAVNNSDTYVLINSAGAVVSTGS